MSEICQKTFFSCRPEQVLELQKFNIIPDTFDDLGAFGGILSAFRKHPNATWFVVACDLPLVDKLALEELTNKRQKSAIATAFYNPVTKFPEPLITIWESKSYPILLQFLAQGYACPRKVLINSNIELVTTSRPQVLKNVNRPEEYQEVMESLKMKKNNHI